MRLPKQPYCKQDKNSDRKRVITVFHQDQVAKRQQHREEKLFSFELETKGAESNKKHKILIKQTFPYYKVCKNIPNSV